MDERCPCGRGLTYGECCGPILDGAPAVTAEALMRSRYTAYARGHSAHLMRSWHPDTRPADTDTEPGLRWTGLTVLSTARGGMFDADGEVEFRACYREDGEPGEMLERSRFVRHDGAWVYWGPTR